MDVQDIQASEAEIIGEMNSVSLSQSVGTSHGLKGMLRDTSRLQRHSDQMKLDMLSGKDVSMAEVMEADSKASVKFSATSMLIKKLSEGAKTILNTPL